MFIINLLFGLDPTPIMLRPKISVSHTEESTKKEHVLGQLRSMLQPKETMPVFEELMQALQHKRVPALSRILTDLRAKKLPRFFKLTKRIQELAEQTGKSKKHKKRIANAQRKVAFENFIQLYLKTAAKKKAPSPKIVKEFVHIQNPRLGQLEASNAYLQAQLMAEKSGRRLAEDRAWEWCNVSRSLERDLKAGSVQRRKLQDRIAHLEHNNTASLRKAEAVSAANRELATLQRGLPLPTYFGVSREVSGRAFSAEDPSPSLQQELGRLEGQIGRLNRENQQLKEQKRALELECELSSTKNKGERLEREFKKAREYFLRLGEKRKLELEIKFLEEKEKQLVDEVKKARDAFEAFSLTYRGLLEERDYVQGRVEQLQAESENARQDSTVGELRHELSQLRSLQESKDMEFYEMCQKLGRKEEEVLQREDEIEALGAAFEGEREEFERYRYCLAQFVRDKDRIIRALTEELERVKKELDGLKRSLESKEVLVVHCRKNSKSKAAIPDVLDVASVPAPISGTSSSSIPIVRESDELQLKALIMTIAGMVGKSKVFWGGTDFDPKKDDPLAFVCQNPKQRKRAYEEATEEVRGSLFDRFLLLYNGQGSYRLPDNFWTDEGKYEKSEYGFFDKGGSSNKSRRKETALNRANATYSF